MADFLRNSAAPERPRQETDACLSDEDVVAFAVGRFSSARLPEAHLHLDRCETCQRLLSEAAHALATAATAPLSANEAVGFNTTFRPGAVVGQRYLIRRFIARGGMGEVYDAFDRDLQERVALKTVTSTACDNPLAVRRLKAEVQLARRVSHPNVCRIYDFGTHLIAETSAQISFLTMEFADGETLGQRVRLAGALPVAEARELGRQLLLGLSAAHAAGVLHRDFKSDNVMLRDEAGDQVSPLILDFGLARALDQESQHSASASNRGLVGTYGYIAPEQLEGKPHSTASDIYSFGVVWFEMLTGELPFEGSSSPAVAALERLQRPAPAPSSRNPEVPASLDAVVLRCLRRSPKERFGTAVEVLAALSAVEEKPRKALQRRLLAPLALAACVGGIGAYWVRPAPHKPAPATLTSALHPTLPTPQGDGPRSLEPPASASEVQDPAPATTHGAADPPAGYPPIHKPSQRLRPRGGAGQAGAPGAENKGIRNKGLVPPDPVADIPAASSSAPPRPAESAAPATKGWEYPFNDKGSEEPRSVDGATHP